MNTIIGISLLVLAFAAAVLLIWDGEREVRWEAENRYHTKPR